MAFGDDFGSFKTIRSSKYGDSFDVPTDILDQPEMVKAFITSQREMRKQSAAPVTTLPKKQPVEHSASYQEMFHDSLPGILTDPEAYKNYEFHPVEDIYEPIKSLATKAYKGTLPTVGEEDAPFGISLPTQKAGKAIGEAAINIGKNLWGGKYGEAAGEAAVTAPEQFGIPVRSMWGAIAHPTIQNVREAGTDVALGAGLGAVGMKTHANMKGWRQAAQEAENQALIEANSGKFHGPYPDVSGGQFDLGAVSNPDVETGNFRNYQQRVEDIFANQKRAEALQQKMAAEEAARKAETANNFENQDWYEQQRRLGKSVSARPEDFPGLSSIADTEIAQPNRVVMNALLPSGVGDVPHLGIRYPPSANRNVWSSIIPERLQGPTLGLTDPERVTVSSPNVRTIEPPIGPIRDTWTRGVPPIDEGLVERLTEPDIPYGPEPPPFGPERDPMIPQRGESVFQYAARSGQEFPPASRAFAESGITPSAEMPVGPPPGLPLTKEDFHNVADAQRGHPERAMVDAQMKMGGGVMGPTIEHVGDLTHRMAERNTWDTAGYEFVKDKVDKTLRWLKNPYGFEREHGENLRNNAAYYGKDLQTHVNEVNAALEKYSAAHENVPALNEAQRLARDAAVSLGRGDFKTTVANLEALKSRMGSLGDWVKYAHEGLADTGQISEPIHPALEQFMNEGDRRILPPEDNPAMQMPEGPPPELHDAIAGNLDELGDSPAADIARERLAAAAPKGSKLSQMVQRNKQGIGDVYEVLKELGLESDEHALRKFGDAGNLLADTANRVDADSARFAAKQMTGLRSAIEAIPKSRQNAAFEEAVNHVETNTTSAKPEIQRIVEELRKQDVIGNQLYTKSGMKVKNPVTGAVEPYAARENYFPHVYPEGFNPPTDIASQFAQENNISLAQARKIIAEGSRQGYGFLDSLKSRLRNLPGYRKDVDIQYKHYIDMARKAHIDANLGELGDMNSPVRKAIEDIRSKMGNDAAIKAEDIMARYMGKDSFQGRSAYRSAANFATKFEAITKLSLSSFRNLPGGVASTLSRTEILPYMKAVKDMFTKAGRHSADEMGILTSLWRDAAKDVGYGSGAGKVYGVEASETFLRRFAALAGKHEVETLFKRAKANPTEFNQNQLKTFILEDDIPSVLKQDKLTEDQVARAGNRMVDLTQGRANSLSLPHAWSSPNPVANVLTQFRKYAFIQSKNYKDAFFRGYEPTAADLKSPATMAKLAKNWNYSMVPKMAVGMAAIGEIPSDIRAWIKGDKRPDPFTMARMVDNASNAFGLGMVGDTISAFRRGGPGDAALSLAPPALSDFYRFGSAGAKALAGKPNTLAQEAAGQVPIVGARLRKMVKGEKPKKSKEIQYY